MDMPFRREIAVLQGKAQAEQLDPAAIINIRYRA
jgi:hypothetical protein